jgi:hypothetical protein
MIAATEIAMPGTYWHHDDFLFEVQYPPTNEESMEPRKAGDEFLERCLRRLRRTGFTRPQAKPQLQPQPAVVGIGIPPEIVSAFQSFWNDYLAKHPPRLPGQ